MSMTNATPARISPHPYATLLAEAREKEAAGRRHAARRFSISTA